MPKTVNWVIKLEVKEKLDGLLKLAEVTPEQFIYNCFKLGMPQPSLKPLGNAFGLDLKAEFEEILKQLQ
jgi:hypothetical protein